MEKTVEEYIEMVRNDGIALEDVPEEVQMAHSEICIEAVKQNGYALQYVPEEVQMAHPEICIEAVKQNVFALIYIPNEVKIAHPEIYIEAVKQNAGALQDVPNEVKIAHPEMCMEAVKQYGPILQDVPEEVQIAHPEICIEALKQNIEVYLEDYFFARDSEAVQNFMFEDANRIAKIKEKANFDISINYNKLQMDMFYYQMIKSIGLDEVERLVEIPSLSKEEIKQYGLEYNEKLNELFKKTYTIKGDIGAAIDIFRGINLGVYEKKGKNTKFEVFKNINRILEDSTNSNLSVEQLLVQAIEKSGLEIDGNVIEKLKGRKDIVVKRLTNERYEQVEGVLKEILDSSLVSQQAPIKRIIEAKIKENIQKNEGTYNEEELLESISKELERKNEDGNNFYSPHITNQKEEILNATKEFVESNMVKNILSKSLVETIREQKEHIGKGWIRKIQNIPVELDKEEFEEVSKILGGIDSSDVDVRMELRDGKDAEEAYKILAEIGVKGVVTYEQVEMMFSSMREPYSEKFKEYYKQHREEILGNPKVYMKLSQIHNNFDNIVSKPEVVNRYNRGELSLDNILQILAEQKYENVREGNERLADISANAGVDKGYFDSAQKVYEITKKREGSTLPQVKVQKSKYRGRMLRADDPLNIVIGDITDCCQKLGDVGEGTMIHAATEKNGAIFVVEELDEEGNVVRPVAQSWTWRNNGRICYDNIEIRKETLEGLDKEAEKEIMDIYIEAGRRAIEADEKAMTKLLKEGKITQAVYDEVVLKEVTCGTGYNDLGELERRIDEGELQQTEEIILPKESEREYEGYKRKKPWIDSKDKQILLVSMDEEKRKEIEKRRKERAKKNEDLRDIEVPIEYKNAREVEEHKGTDIYPSDIERIKKIEKAVYREKQQILNNCKGVEDLAEAYGLEEEKVELILSKDGDWYFIGQENSREYYIADVAMVGGVNSERNEQIGADVKMATVELAERVYSKMLEMAEKGKNVRYEATRDTSYINTKKMEEKGLIEIIEEKKAKFENSDIDMNNVVVKVNVDKLKEELSNIRELLEKLRQRGVTKASFRENRNTDNISL